MEGGQDWVPITLILTLHFSKYFDVILCQFRRTYLWIENKWGESNPNVSSKCSIFEIFILSLCLNFNEIYNILVRIYVTIRTFLTFTSSTTQTSKHKVELLLQKYGKGKISTGWRQKSTSFTYTIRLSVLFAWYNG